MTQAPLANTDNGALLADRYRIDELIGRGGMAAVYRAKDELLGRDVAVKLFPAGPVDDEDFRLRQENEMRLLAEFDHPGLVRLFDAGTDIRDPAFPRAFLVMELVSGSDLRAHIAKGPLTVEETARLGAQLASALELVHAKGIIHRDIKPANILLTEDPAGKRDAKLADFGTARTNEGHRLTATGVTVGTAHYLSPEQAMGTGLTPASDIYSLALVLLECLKGQVEYPGMPMESASARFHRAPAIPSGLSAEFGELLAAMTDIDPENRPTAAVVASTLQAMPAERRTAKPTVVVPPRPANIPIMGPTAKLSADHATTLPASGVPAGSQLAGFPSRAQSSGPAGAANGAAPRMGVTPRKAAAVAASARKSAISRRSRMAATAVLFAAMVVAALSLVAFLLQAPAASPISPSPSNEVPSNQPTPVETMVVPAPAEEAPAEPVVVPGPVQTVEVPVQQERKGKPTDNPGNGNGKAKGKQD